MQHLTVFPISWYLEPWDEFASTEPLALALQSEPVYSTTTETGNVTAVKLERPTAEQGPSLGRLRFEELGPKPQTQTLAFLS